ncbi:hypothetical protein [Dyadobacter soli]|nr:hypothetical protein [Dyadobacter soli]
MKNLKKTPAKQYPEQPENIARFEDFRAPYHATTSVEKEEFRNSLPFLLMGCAKGPFSKLSDAQIKQMMIADKHRL